MADITEKLLQAKSIDHISLDLQVREGEKFFLDLFNKGYEEKFIIFLIVALIIKLYK
jgi:hypothetical protein